MNPTSSRIRRRATVAITAALAAAVTIAASAVAAPALAGAAPQPPALATAGQPASPAAGPSRRAAAPADPAGAFLFRNGRFTPLGTIPAAAAAGHVNRNNRGQVVGLYIDAAEAASVPPGQLPPIRSFVEDPRGRVTTFAVPGASATLATGINDRGQIAGTWFDDGVTIGDAPYPPGTVHGFVRQPGGRITTIDLPRFANTAVTDINDRGQLVGQNAEFTAEQAVGFLREPNGRVTVIDLPGRANVEEFLALNDRGRVVGQWDDRFETDANEPGSRHGFVWDRGRVTRLDVPGSLSTGALGVNDAGQISGSYDDAGGGHHGFVLQRGRFTRIDAPGRTVTDAWGGNDRGEVVIPELGTGLDPVTR